MVYCGSQDSNVKIFKLDPSRLIAGGKKTQDDNMLHWTSSTGDKDSHLSVINSLEVCGKYVCSAGGDTTVRVWLLGSLEPIRVLRGHRGSILTLKSIGETLLSGGRDNTIRCSLSPMSNVFVLWSRLDCEKVVRATLDGV